MEWFDNLQELCRNNEIAVTKLEKKLGFANGSLSGTGTIRSDRLLKIANYFGVSTDYILGNDKNSNNFFPVSSGTEIKILGKVSAGNPIEQIEDVIGTETISQDMAAQGDFFGLRVRGDSMEPLIHNGSTLIVRQQEDVENGLIAIVSIGNEEATCKRIEKYSHGIMLIPENKSYKEMFYTNKEIEELPVRILGRVIQSRTTL